MARGAKLCGVPDLTPEQAAWLHRRACRLVGESNALLVRLRRAGYREDDPLLRGVKLYAAGARELWHCSIVNWPKGPYRQACKRTVAWPRL